MLESAKATKKRTRQRLEMNVDIEYEIRDKDGNIIKQGKQKARTYLTAWMRLLWGCLQSVYGGSTPSFTIVDTGGASRTFWYGATAPANLHACNAPSTNDLYGLQIGSGTNPRTPSMYTLQTKITSGSGAGQLVYGNHTFEEPIVVSTVTSMRIIRTFTNSSGSSVDINEIGLVAAMGDTAQIQRYVLLISDKLSGTLTVPNGSTATIRYVPSITTS